MSDDVTTPTAGGSMMDRLRAQRKQIAARTSTTIPIAGYKNPQLVAKYRFVPVEQTEEIGARIRQQAKTDTEQLLFASIDIMVEACEGLYLREAGSKELQPLDPHGDGPLTFSDERLAEFLGFDNESGGARGSVRGVFVGPDGNPNDYAIVEHGRRLQAWMADTSIRVDEDSLGEA